MKVQILLGIRPEAIEIPSLIKVMKDEALAWAHVLVLLFEHAQVKCIKPELARHQMLIDTRGIWKEKP